MHDFSPFCLIVWQHQSRAPPTPARASRRSATSGWAACPWQRGSAWTLLVAILSIVPW